LRPPWFRTSSTTPQTLNVSRAVRLVVAKRAIG
jgi:hypothetical protein